MLPNLFPSLARPYNNPSRTLFDNPEFDHYKYVVFYRDEKIGLKARLSLIIIFEPAAGGSGMWPYHVAKDIGQQTRYESGLQWIVAAANDL